MISVQFPSEAVYQGDLILVNREYSHRVDQSNRLTYIQDDVQLNDQAARMLTQLLDQIGGWNQIVPVSGWRSGEEQQRIWDDTLEEHGTLFTETYVAVPGHSEHETGLAIDLGLQKDVVDFLCPDFPYTGICQTFREVAPHYGFIERYPAGRENVTKIGHEPWHFRYVGVPHGTIMTELNLTLEEYILFLKNYSGKRPYHYERNGLYVSISYWKAVQNGITVIQRQGKSPYSISGNNIDGFILTEWEGPYAAKELRRT